jgi:hypothetical protein
MALRTYLYSFSNLADLSSDHEQDDASKLIWLDERAYTLSLCWLALFRVDDLLEYSATSQPLRELTGKNLDVVGPVPEPVTEKRIAPVARREKALAQLEQSKAILAETFPDHPNLPAWLDVMRLHLEKHPQPWLALEWTDLLDAGGEDFFWKDIRWIMEGWNDPTRTRTVTLSKTLLDHLLFRKPAVRIQSWRDELMKWAGLDLSLDIPSPASGTSDEDEDEDEDGSNPNYYKLLPCLDAEE